MSLTAKILMPALKKAAQEIRDKHKDFVINPNSSFFFNAIKERNYLINTITLLVFFTFVPKSVNIISKETADKFSEELKVFLRLSKINFGHIQTIFKTHEFSTS